MQIIIYCLFAVALFFVFLTILLSYQKHTLKQLLKQKEKAYQDKTKQLALLEYIQKAIDYSLDTEKVLQIITKSFAQTIPFETISTLVIHDDHLVLTTITQGSVSKQFITEVKNTMLASLKKISRYPLPTAIEEKIEGKLLEYTNQTEKVSSSFAIPVTISNKLAGMITIASTIENYYAQSDTQLFSATAKMATDTVTRLREIIDTEKNRSISLITSLQDGIIMIDENDILQVINNSAKDILSIHKESPAMFDVLASLAKALPIDEELQQTKTQHKALHAKEIVIGDKTIQLDITPVETLHATSLQKDTTVIGTSLVLHDITLEKSLNQLKETFTNEIVHELRSPLTAIKASAMLIATDKTLPEEHAKFIDIIVKQSERMLNDITSLLDAAKLETGKFSILQKPTDIAKLIADSSMLFKTVAENKKINLTTDIADKLPQGMIDANRITQVVNNLISNAMKFTPENGTITIHAGYHYNEHLPTTKTNPGILISVIDTGIGIAKDKQGILFSKFGQVKNAKATKEPGTGLGLYVSKGIVEAHGGSIFLESEEGKGTTIGFTVPIAG